MKKITIYTLLLAVFSISIANAKVTDQQMSMCKSQEKMAGSIMNARQSGVQMSTLLENLKQVPPGNDEIINLYSALVAEAYKTSRFETDKNKKNAVLDFSNEVFSNCFNIYNK